MKILGNELVTHDELAEHSSEIAKRHDDEHAVLQADISQLENTIQTLQDKLRTLAYSTGVSTLIAVVAITSYVLQIKWF